MVNYFKGLFLVTVFLVSAQAMSSNIESADADAVELQKGQSNVLIEWIEPKKFRDVRHPTMSRKRHRESVLLELETFFTSLGEELPEGHKLNLRVTDLDLAGTVQPPGMVGLRNFPNRGIENYRIVRNIDIPRMTFSYELVDDQGKILQQEEVNLKDMSFLSRAGSANKNTSLKYEKVMISRWFKETFISESE
ncbi:MAG: hypothetical protein ACI9IT_000246 [Glaciecola sp.]|jgi:hypothetical protein